MPLSSPSAPSCGASGTASMAAPSFIRFAVVSASFLPYTAVLRPWNMRPKRPSNMGEWDVDNSPRRGEPCAALIFVFLRARLFVVRLGRHAKIDYQGSGENGI